MDGTAVVIESSAIMKTKANTNDQNANHLPNARPVALAEPESSVQSPEALPAKDETRNLQLATCNHQKAPDHKASSVHLTLATISHQLSSSVNARPAAKVASLPFPNSSAYFS
jgi:hypothetical protein